MNLTAASSHRVDFQFDPATHIYRLNGVRIPSVTGVLESVGIIDYSFLPEGERQQYLERGRRVHAMTHFDDEGDLDPETVHPDDAGFLTAWRRCKETCGWQSMRAIERQLFCPKLRFAGTLDRVAASGPWPTTGRVWLLDLKSGSAPWWVGIQLAAYGHLLGGIEHQASVELHDDGTFEARPINASAQRENLNTFLAALRVYHAKERRGR